MLIPVKTFDRAKARLADALDEADRSRLARLSAGRVLAAASPLDVFVVCDDSEVASWAVALGARTLTPPVPGLNQAVAFGVERLRQLGYGSAIVAHGDLPLARSLAWVGAFRGVSIVTDRHGDGTNVLALPTTAGFAFNYGPGSGRRHRKEALGLGLSVRWIRHQELSHDIDTPTDLDALDHNMRSKLVAPAERYDQDQDIADDSQG